MFQIALVLLSYLTCSSFAIQMGVRPFVLKLQPINDTIVRSNLQFSLNNVVRTKPKFFEDVLGIKPGANATLSYQRWLELKSSGLFTNLTMEAVVDQNGDMSYLVFGKEKSSRQFSPEVSIASNKYGGFELSGGVSNIFTTHYSVFIPCFNKTAQLHRSPFPRARGNFTGRSSSTGRI